MIKFLRSTLKFIKKKKEKIKEIAKTKIVLGHHPDNAKLLELNLQATLKPDLSLHSRNIKNRSDEMKKIAQNSYSSLEDYPTVVYSSYLELEEIIARIQTS